MWSVWGVLVNPCCLWVFASNVLAFLTSLNPTNFMLQVYFTLLRLGSLRHCATNYTYTRLVLCYITRSRSNWLLHLLGSCKYEYSLAVLEVVIRGISRPNCWVTWT